MSKSTINVLVTGANGFLGSHILSALINLENVNVIAACRDIHKLPPSLQPQARIGDLRDDLYRRQLPENIDVICHAGTWASMWGNKNREQNNFFEPTIDLIKNANTAGVSRFIMTSTVVVSNCAHSHEPISDFAPPSKTGFWHHLDYLIEIDKFMQAQAHSGMQMITMRLGHFVGAGNKLGIVPVLVPRLKTLLVPWLASGRSRMPLVGGKDMGQAYALVVQANQAELNNYESFTIVGDTCPTSREVFNYICEKIGSPKPLYSVPFSVGHGFAWLMETLHPMLPEKAPFLTRSIVHLAKDWYCTSDYAHKKLGFRSRQSWQHAVDEALADLKINGMGWPPLMQKV